MTSLSKRIPVTVIVDMPDLQDAMMLMRRGGFSLGHVMSEALHMGMAAFVDKCEAVWMREPDRYPILDTGVPDVQRYLHTNRMTSDNQLAAERKEFARAQLHRRSGG